MLETIVLALAYPTFIAIGPLWICYSIGMAEYARLNITRMSLMEDDLEVARRERRMILSHLYDECGEFGEAVIGLHCVDTILEFFDILQLVIKYLISLFSIDLLKNEFVWMLVFPFILPASLKLGWRYLFNNCIRNHENPHNRGHMCFFQGPQTTES